MFLQVALMTIFVHGASSVCTFPASIRGQWGSAFENWNDLTITSNTITGMKPEGRALDFSCYQRINDTYVIESEAFSFGPVQFQFYVCIDIVPAAASDVLYFRVLTDPNPDHQNFSVMSYTSDNDRNVSEICTKPSTEVPLHYDVFLQAGIENNFASDRCPRSLHATFMANFTDSLEYAKCPEGFEINGCNNRSHLLFNYTQCSGDQASNGVPEYTCLTSLEKGNMTYTTITMEMTVGQQNVYEISCMEQTMVDGEMYFTKSAGSCGGVPSVQMMANETASCRLEPPASTTEAGTNSSSQAPSSGPSSPGGGGQGGGDNGEVDDGSGAASIFFSFGTLLIATIFGLLTSASP